MEQNVQSLLDEMKNSGTKNTTDTEKQTSSEVTKCPLCNGTGWELYVGEDGNEYARECSCGLRQKDISENRLRFATIPETYKEVTLKDIKTKWYTKPDSKDVIKATGQFVKWYLENLEENIESGKGIYFWSDAKGSGKTMVAAAIANELIHNHKRFVKFATSLDILDEIRATYNKDSEESESKLLHDLVTADFLIIDDFGTERATDWAGEKFYQIVNKRYINKKVTFYTSNYDLNTLKYDDRISSRIRERTFIVHFPEESVREFIAREDERKVKELI